MTEPEFQSWLLDDSAIRCVLVEVDVKTGGVETTRYLSNKGYKDTNKFYLPLVEGGMTFTESIDVEGGFSLNYGDIELSNIDGEIDSWIDDVWENRGVELFIGDESWPREDFYPIFSGVVAGIDSRSNNTLNLKIVDKLQRLNTTMTETKLGGSTTNADKLIPITLGEVHNVTPLLTDASVLEYAVNTSDVELVIEVRDNGVPVEFTDMENGRFRLNQSSYGTVTASVQGMKSSVEGGYFNSVPACIRFIVQELLSEEKSFSDAEIDLANFASIASEYPHPVGMYVAAKTNALTACNDLAESIGCRLTVTRAGKLKLVRLSPEREDVGTVVTASNMHEKTLSMSSIPTVVAAVKLGYAKNYTVQTNLTTGIPAAHIDLYAQEWLTVTRSSSGTSADYKLHTDPDQRDTLLLRESDAIIEAESELEIFGTRRKVLSYKGFPELLTQQLGDTQTIVHPRYGLASGKAGQIVKVVTNWIDNTVEISVFI